MKCAIKLVIGWRILKKALRASLFNPSVRVSTLFATAAPPLRVQPAPLPPKPAISSPGEAGMKKAAAKALSRELVLNATALTVAELVNVNGAVNRVELVVGTVPSRG